MTVFEQGDVVRVPFPYTDKATRQHRPALVVSKGRTGAAGRLLWVVMITSAENAPWPGDHHMGGAYQDAGLPVPSIIRPTKIATIEAEDADVLGAIGATLLSDVLGTIAGTVGLESGASAA